MVIREIDEHEIDSALKLVLDTFMKHESTDYSKEGIETFKTFISDENIMSTLTMYGAFEEKRIVGVVATKNKGSHIKHYFSLIRLGLIRE